MTQAERQAKNRVDAAIDSLGKTVDEVVQSNAAPTNLYESEAAEGAERVLIGYFRDFASKTKPEILNSYFHGMNRSNWTKDFAAYLVERNREASND